MTIQIRISCLQSDFFQTRSKSLYLWLGAGGDRGCDWCAYGCDCDGDGAGDRWQVTGDGWQAPTIAIADSQDNTSLIMFYSLPRLLDAAQTCVKHHSTHNFIANIFTPFCIDFVCILHREASRISIYALFAWLSQLLSTKTNVANVTENIWGGTQDFETKSFSDLLKT